MGAKPDELQEICSHEPIDQHQVWAQMAIAMVVPLATQRMIVKAGAQEEIAREPDDNAGKLIQQHLSVPPSHLTLEVFLESSELTNCPHAGQP